MTVEPIKGWKTNLMISRKETETTSQNYYSSGYLGNKKASEDSETSTQTTVRGSASKGSYLDRSDNLELTSKYDFTVGKNRIKCFSWLQLPV